MNYNKGHTLTTQTSQAEPPTEVTKDGTTDKKESNSD